MAKYESAIPYIQKAEGGLSRAVTDSAHLNPSPYTYDGKTGWHTNRGITFGTFKELAPKGGYEVSEANFIRMPDNVWLKIYRVGFWDAMKGDLYNSQPIANAVVDFAWASGIGGASKSLIKFLNKKGISANGPISIAEGFNKLSSLNERQTFLDIIQHRRDFFNSLGEKSNPGGVYTKGWMNRMDALQKQGESLLGKAVAKVGRHLLPVTLVLLGVAGLITSLMMKN